MRASGSLTSHGTNWRSYRPGLVALVYAQAGSASSTYKRCIFKQSESHDSVGNFLPAANGHSARKPLFGRVNTIIIKEIGGLMTRVAFNVDSSRASWSGKFPTPALGRYRCGATSIGLLSSTQQASCCLSRRCCSRCFGSEALPGALSTDTSKPFKEKFFAAFEMFSNGVLFRHSEKMPRFLLPGNDLRCRTFNRDFSPYSQRFPLPKCRKKDLAR